MEKQRVSSSTVISIRLRRPDTDPGDRVRKRLCIPILWGSRSDACGDHAGIVEVPVFQYVHQECLRIFARCLSANGEDGGWPGRHFRRSAARSASEASAGEPVRPVARTATLRLE